jgi:lactam utilization protein B
MLFYQFLRYEYKAFKTRDYDDDGKLLPLDRESKEGKAKINDLNKIMESIKKYTSQEKSITLAIVNELKQHFKII